MKKVALTKDQKERRADIRARYEAQLEVIRGHFGSLTEVVAAMRDQIVTLREIEHEAYLLTEEVCNAANDVLESMSEKRRESAVGEQIVDFIDKWESLTIPTLAEDAEEVCSKIEEVDCEHFYYNDEAGVHGLMESFLHETEFPNSLDEM